MGYGKSKPGMFKMKYSGVPALMKALTGGQKEMVSKMREQGKTSAADKIEKGILAQPEKAAPKKITDKNRKTLGRGGKDVVLSEKETIERRPDDSNSGARDFEQVTQTVEKGSSAQRGTTMSDRQGGGRMGQKTYQRVKGNKGKYTMTGSNIAGTKTINGQTQYRKLKDGSEVVVEASLSPKARGSKAAKIKASGSVADLKKQKTSTAGAAKKVKGMGPGKKYKK